MEILCTQCRSIDFSCSPLQLDEPVEFPVGGSENSREYLVYYHHSSIDALRAAAIEGCHLCSQIRQELFHIRGHERDDEYHKGPIEIRYYPKISDAKTVLPQAELVVVAKTPIRNVRLSFNLVRYSSSLGALLIEKAFNNDQSTGCKENVKLAMAWLNQCLSSHELCTISTNAYPSLPSRILDVEGDGGSVTLCLCPGDDRHGPYITLSHVWGKAQVITTTLSTIKARMTAIEMKDLSKTFQDAVVIAREMRVRYLWIDSLCIIQDSFDDWAKESSKMGGYYMNSLFNISAVSASNGSGGCFMARNALHTTPCEVRFRLPGIIGNESRPLFLRPSLGWDPALETVAFQRPPLWQRAWVVQERFLSARLLQFSSMQMSWKCRTMVASESAPEGESDFVIRRGDRILQDTLVGLNKFMLSSKISGDRMVSGLSLPYGTPEELMDLYDAWYDLVSLYGKCTLTKESDIFPAISGIAKAVATATGEKYAAGLWENDLHRGLLWSAPDSTGSKPDLRRYRAPSWSWASLKATCTFYVREISQAGKRVDKSHFIINSIIGSTSDSNPYGEVAQAELKISGLLKRAHPRGGDEGDIIFESIVVNRDRHSLFDLKEKRAIGYYFADNMDKRLLTEIWCCAVMTEEEIVEHNSPSSVIKQTSRPVEARCLALVAVNEIESIYMRVGSAWIQDFAWFSDCISSHFSII